MATKYRTRLLNRYVAAWVSLLLVLASFFPTRVLAQTPPKAIVLAWDGAVPAFVNEMLRSGDLPNLAKLIEGGAFADDVIPCFPPFTASGFASLWTGAPPRITGISGNRVPRLPRSAFTILESSGGFNNALLQAEPLWATAERAGWRVVVTHVPFGGDKSDQGVHFQGYRGIAGRDGVINGRSSKPQPANSWANLPSSAVSPLEITLSISGSTFYGLLIDDPSDPQKGHDTLLVASARDGEEIKAKLKSKPAGPGRELFWSKPFDVKTNNGRDATVYLRLFDLKPDGSDFLLFFTRPTREMISPPDLAESANRIARAFIGNGAHQLYGQGAFGATLPNGGDGTAEARYLETLSFAQHQIAETNRWALEQLPWELFVAYTPFPDEAEHLWRGFLEPSLPDFRQDIADRLRPLLQQVYRLADALLGLLIAHRTENTIVALISDHGIEATHRLVAVNKLLQENGILVTDEHGRIDLARTKAVYPAMNQGYLLVNSTDRKGGIVTPEERGNLIQRIRELLFEIRDGERQIVTAVYDAQADGNAMGIGGESGGDIYIDLLPGYEPDPRLGVPELVGRREPRGMHGFNPLRPSMRTLMVLNGPGVGVGRRLQNVRIIDFAPTLAKLLRVPIPKDATGRVLYEAFSDPR
ncbi:MAG TPA: alkaline phosphatase family protein [Candidatus Binatia bacterium]|nr:alkaline phosphatase family protein [Candidatus Binatia bacterium]